MIALSTVFICLAVWMDLKTPEYLSGYHHPLSQGWGPRFLDIMDPKQDVVLLLEAFLMVFVGLLAFKSRCQLTTRLRVSRGITYLDAEITTPFDQQRQSQ